jgi:CheY-like chemotaxis protein
MLLAQKRIFMIEDNTNNLAVAMAHLRSQGATVLYEKWGSGTPELIARALPIDVILLDLMLPNDVNGFDVFDEIQQVPDLAAILVVVISAVDPDVAMPKARQKGLAGFIAKPISVYIGKYIADVLGGKQVWIAESQR